MLKCFTKGFLFIGLILQLSCQANEDAKVASHAGLSDQQQIDHIVSKLESLPCTVSVELTGDRKIVQHYENDRARNCGLDRFFPYFIDSDSHEGVITYDPLRTGKETIKLDLDRTECVKDVSLEPEGWLVTVVPSHDAEYCAAGWAGFNTEILSSSQFLFRYKRETLCSSADGRDSALFVRDYGTEKGNSPAAQLSGADYGTATVGGTEYNFDHCEVDLQGFLYDFTCTNSAQGAEGPRFLLTKGGTTPTGLLRNGNQEVQLRCEI
jgi:hypothetical protein